MTAEFVAAKPADVAGSRSAETRFQVYVALTATAATANVSALSKKLVQQIGLKPGLTLTVQVAVSDSTAKADGVVNVNIS